MESPTGKGEIEQDEEQRQTVLNVEPWSIEQIAQAAERRSWNQHSAFDTPTKVCVAFGVGIDREQWWCSCCCKPGEKRPPSPTWKEAGIANEKDARAKQALSTEEMLPLPRRLVHALLTSWQVESLTLELLNSFPGERVWDVFADLAPYYGCPVTPAEITEGLIYHAYRVDPAPPLLRSLTLINWHVRVKDLENIANAFPLLQRLDLRSPVWSADTRELVREWYSDRLPFMTISCGTYDTEIYEKEEKLLHVYGGL